LDKKLKKIQKIGMMAIGKMLTNGALAALLVVEALRQNKDAAYPQA